MTSQTIVGVLKGYFFLGFYDKISFYGQEMFLQDFVLITRNIYWLLKNGGLL